MTGMTAAIPLSKAGKIRPLAYGGLQRSKVLPDVPTLSESGFKGFDSGAGFLWMLPAATPKAVVERIAADAGRVLGMAEFVEKFVTAPGHEVMNLPGPRVFDILVQERKIFSARVKPLNLRIALSRFTCRTDGVSIFLP